MDASGKIHDFHDLASENYTPLPVIQEASWDTKTVWTFGEEIRILNLPGMSPGFSDAQAVASSPRQRFSVS